MLNVLDEFSHECLAIRVARKLKAIDVIEVLSVRPLYPAWAFSLTSGPTSPLTSAGRPLGERLHREVQRLRDELLNGESFYTLREGVVVA